MLHACSGEMDRSVGMSRSHCQNRRRASTCELIRRVRVRRAEGTTTVDEISPPGDSAGNGIAERDILTVGGARENGKSSC